MKIKKKPMIHPKSSYTTQEPNVLGSYFDKLKLSSGVVLVLSLLSISSFGQIRVLDSSAHYLRGGKETEWDEFTNSVPKKELMIFFDISVINKYSLSVVQYDVKQNWSVLLNNKKVGSLVVDGNKMNTYFELHPEFLTAGKNKLSIQPDTDIADDIVISDIILYERPIETVLAESTINIEVIERETNTFLPSRITIVDKKGTLQTIGNTGNELAVRPGFIYSGSGKVSLLVPQGEYTIYAGRGFEYNVDSTFVRIGAGEQASKKLVLQREVDTDGWVSSDTHIHTLTHSGHGDATDRERALSIAGEGIEMPVITEHNKLVDFSIAAKDMKVNSFFSIIPGDELTTPVGHFNVFPFLANDTAPNHQVKNWAELSANLPKEKSQVVILNHGRDIHNKFRPFDPQRHISVAGFSLDNWNIPANAMEIVNSGALQHDPLTLVFDWFGLLNRGYNITPIGSSDSHDVSRYLVGQARTYVKSSNNDPAKIEVVEVLKNLKLGKVMVSFGLLPKVLVNRKYGPGDTVLHAKNTVIDIEVTGPGWISAERVSLYANGIKIREEKIKPGKAPGIKWKGEWKLQVMKNDVFLVVIAEGGGDYLPYWPIVKPYQPVSKSWKPYTIGSSGAIWIDADGDGKISTAYDYGKKLTIQHGKDYSNLFSALSSYDESVSIQAAALLYETGRNLSSPDVTSALSRASKTTKEGFRKFIAGLPKSK